MIERETVEWEAFKALLAKKNPNHQHTETNTAYGVWFDDGHTQYFCGLIKGTAEADEFVADYLESSGWAIGSRSYAFATGDFEFCGDGTFGTCTSGQTLSLDYMLPESLYLDGGVIVTEGAALGDWIEVVIVHPTYGVIKTYIVKRYVPASPAGHPTPLMEVKTPYAGLVPAGLKVRGIYHSTGGVDVKVGINLDLHRPI
jgi:hypothetical protein